MKSKKYIVAAVFLCLVFVAKAQEGLEIQKVFQQYGKSKGVTMVELSNKKYGNYVFSFYKSITIDVDKNPEAAKFARECILKTEQQAKKVKQITVNGVPQSVFLQIPKKEKYYGLILYNDLSKKEKRIILVYIESETNSEEILNYILNKNNNK